MRGFPGGERAGCEIQVVAERRKQLAGLADWPLAVDAEAAEVLWLLKR